MIHCIRDNEALAALPRSLRTERLFGAFGLAGGEFGFNEAEQLCFAAEADGELTGLFVFNRYEAEKMLEKNKWLSRSETACREMFDYLKERYPAFRAEFTFAPEERLLKELLTEYGAEVFPEQQNMALSAPPAAVDAAGVEPLSEPYRERYFALHRESDGYVSGERAAAEPETYRVLIAAAEGEVVGYLDVTHCCETNNIADLYVRKEMRGKGWGARLLAKAIELNAPKGMTLQVDLTNAPALRLYEKMGFRKIEGRNFIDAIWRI